MDIDESRSSEDFHEFANEAPIGIMRADAAGMCFYANPAWSALTGLQFDETVGYAWSSAVHPDDLERTMALWAESVDSRKPYVNELRIVNKNGEVKRVIAHATVTRDREGEITGYIGTIMDITPLYEAEQFLRRLIDVQEEERRSLCHEFHDGLIQHVLAAQMLLEAHQALHYPGAPCTELEEVIGYLRRGVTEARRLIRGIRTSVLDDLGLTAAIDDIAEQLADFGISIVCRVDPAVEAETPERQIIIFRVVQEALANIRKHSGDLEPSLSIDYDEGEISILVIDRGKGFDAASSDRQGFGLAGMRERVRLAGGICRVESQPGHGTRVAVRLPASQSVSRVPSPVITATNSVTKD
jgi:PAS domain S-box-containing protein